MSIHSQPMTILGMIVTTFFYVCSVILGAITLQQIAAAMTIFAGAATGAYTLYKWRRDYLNDKKQRNDSMGKNHE